MTTTSENQKPVTAYCRACGKPLTEDTVRVAMGTVYCEEHLPQAAGGPSTAPAADAPIAGGGPPLANPGISPGLAFLLGMIPGVGAIYNGQYAKGVVHVLILGMLISINSSGAAGGLEPLFGMLTGVFWFYMAFEAYHTARKRQLGEPVDEFSSLVKISMQGPGFPIVPVALIGLGVLFLLNNLGWLRLYQLLRFWPLLLIAVGAYQVYLRMRGSPARPQSSEASHERF
jgi:hypothetical protein